MKILGAAVVMVCALVGGGCSLMTSRPAISVYAPTLAHEDVHADTQQPGRKWQLVVTPPQVIAPLDGMNILVSPTPGEIQVYKGARWRDSAPAMVQDLLLQAFHARGVPVAAPSSGIHADYLLRSELHDFQSEYRGSPNPSVVIRLTFQLVRNSDGVVIQARIFDIEKACSSAQLPDVFAAFQQAMNQVVADIVEWTILAGDGQHPTGNP